MRRHLARLPRTCAPASAEIICPPSHLPEHAHAHAPAGRYSFWGGSLTDAINAEAGPDCFVLNVASQEYAKSVKLKALSVPVVTAVFPGPAVHAKQARGEMVRFCAENSVTTPEALRAFRGTHGNWRFVEEGSDASTLVFHRGGAPAAAPASSSKAKAAASPKQPAAARGAKRPADEALPGVAADDEPGGTGTAAADKRRPRRRS